MCIVIHEAISKQDYIDCAFVTNMITPTAPISSDVLKQGRDTNPDFLLLIARVNGEPTGTGVCMPSSSPNQAYTMIRIVPKWRGKGVGGQLYEKLSHHAKSLGRSSIQGRVNELDSRSLEFFTKRGFKEVSREFRVRLNLENLLVKEVQNRKGIEIISLENREHLWKGAYEVALESIPDIPMPEPLQVPPYEKWIKSEIAAPENLVQGSFVAVVNGEVIGYTGLAKKTDRNLENLLTGVKRNWRGKGIAKLLKDTQLQWAKKHGYKEIVTYMDDTNKPILQLNKSLGYEADPGLIIIRGPLHESVN